MDDFSEEEVDYSEDEWVEETVHEQTLPPSKNLQLVADSAHEYDEFVEEEEEEEESDSEEEIEEIEEIYDDDDDDALSDEQFLSKLHTSFQAMATKSKQQQQQQQHQSSFRSLRSNRSNSLASIKEEDTGFGADAKADIDNSNHSGSYSVDDSASVESDLGSYQHHLS
jgi:hypothetical protein